MLRKLPHLRNYLPDWLVSAWSARRDGVNEKSDIRSWLKYFREESREVPNVKLLVAEIDLRLVTAVRFDAEAMTPSNIDKSLNKQL